MIAGTRRLEGRARSPRRFIGGCFAAAGHAASFRRHQARGPRALYRGVCDETGAETFFTVQRDALDVDELRSPALYLGTTTGQLRIGRDGGEEWDCLFGALPPIHCVKVAVV